MCRHLMTARYGRTDAVGDVVVETRCKQCGQTLDIGEVA